MDPWELEAMLMKNAFDVVFGAKSGVPYPRECLHRELCEGKSSCPREPACID